MTGNTNFSLQIPTAPGLLTKSTSFSLCGGAGGQSLTVADFEALLAAEGLVSPNNGGAAKIVRIELVVAAKNRPTLDQQTDSTITANGDSFTITESGNDQYVHQGERWFESTPLIDADCDMIVDESVDPTIAIAIPENSCAKFAVDYA